ncbi:MAG: hypothetical protein R3B70_18700 [Polyangiaceae bacterium]
MRIAIQGKTLVLADLLSDAYSRLSPQLADKVGLYVVSLRDGPGFSLASAIHAVVRGPDPAEIRRRAQHLGAVEPMMVGTARIDTLASALESLALTAPPDQHLLGWVVREIHRGGDVPVVVLVEGAVIASTLEALREPDSEAELTDAWGWSTPVVGHA